MTCTHWKTVEAFADQAAYEAFLGWLMLQIQSRQAKPVTTTEFKKHFDSDSEKWFRCARCHTVWQLLRHYPHRSSGSFRPMPPPGEAGTP